MSGTPFRFLSQEEFELLEQREKLAYLERALKALWKVRGKSPPDDPVPEAPEILSRLTDEPSASLAEGTTE